MGDFAGLAASLKTALDLAKAAKDVNDQTRVNVAIAGIMDQLMSVQADLASTQAEYQALLEEVSRLKAALDNEERFKDYRMEQTPMGGYVLPLRDECVTDDRPPHAICPQCREDARLSVLTETEHRFECSSCQYTAGKKPRQRFNRQRRGRVIHPGFS